MQIARVFFDVNMGRNFKGLLEIARKAGIKPAQERESFIVFINRAGTKFKVLMGNSYLVYHDNGNRRFPLEALQYLPSAFKGTSFDFTTAVAKSLAKKMRPVG